MPFYVSPEQLMKDRSDFARKGIARGRSVLVMTYADGILFVGENPSRALHKVSEIYDRIAFAAVGKYNEFEALRLAGVRYADLRGYQYDRSDVTSRGLANAYAQTLGSIFTESGKPYEVEIVVGEVGATADDDQLYRLTYDGSVAEEHGAVVIGGQGEPIAALLQAEHRGDMALGEAVRLAVRALGQTGSGEPARTVDSAALEAAVLDRGRPRRAFKRLGAPQLARLLAEDTPVSDPAEDQA
jgi:proteasome alpha subunit